MNPDEPPKMDSWVTLESDMKRPAVQKAAKNLKKAAEKCHKKKKNEKEKSHEREQVVVKSDDFSDKSKLSIPKLDSFNQSSVDSGTSVSIDCSDRREKSPLLQPKWAAQRANSDTGLGGPDPSNSSLLTPRSPTEDVSRSTLKPAQSEELWPVTENNHSMLRNGSIPHSVNVCDPKLMPGKRSESTKRPIISSIDKFLHTRRRNRYQRKSSQSLLDQARKSMPDGSLSQLSQSSVDQKRQRYRAKKNEFATTTEFFVSRDFSFNSRTIEDNEELETSENEELLAREPFGSFVLTPMQKNKPVNVSVVQPRPALPILKPFEYTPSMGNHS